jgi:hypothetical protein
VRAIELPFAFQRFSELDGALEFVVFEDTQGDRASALAAICAAIPGTDQNKLGTLGCRRIDDAAFYGDWYDAETKSLLLRGTYATQDGRTLTDPRLRDLDGVKIAHGGGPIPEAGAGGQFAYAFSWTPYGLQARPTEVQSLFDAIQEFLLPPGLQHEILDWANPRLPDASAYFRAGMEWWGVFLFTVYLPAIKRLTVIAGSTTD